MTADRMARWRAVSLQSFWFDNELNEMLWLIQMLGREDVAIYQFEQLVNADCENIARGKPTQFVDDGLHQMVWRTYTWVLAAYELVRTVSQRLDSTNRHSELTAKARSLKNEFARLRVPFAKFEPASTYKHTDYHFPIGCIQPNRGLCWAVAEGIVVSRMELSDGLLAFLSEFKTSGPGDSANGPVARA
jgi:hypothetical protein